MSRFSYLYCCGYDAPGEPVKLGFTANPIVRRKQIEACNPRPVTLFWATEGTPADEREMFQRYAHLRLRYEWFSDEDDSLKRLHSLPFIMDRDDPRLAETRRVLAAAGTIRRETMDAIGACHFHREMFPHMPVLPDDVRLALLGGSLGIANPSVSDAPNVPSRDGTLKVQKTNLSDGVVA